MAYRVNSQPFKSTRGHQDCTETSDENQFSMPVVGEKGKTIGMHVMSMNNNKRVLVALQMYHF